MNRPLPISAINKLAVAGQQAGFSLEQMIQLLDDGLTVESLLDLIAWSLERRERTGAQFIDHLRLGDVKPQNSGKAVGRLLATSLALLDQP